MTPTSATPHPALKEFLQIYRNVQDQLDIDLIVANTFQGTTQDINDYKAKLRTCQSLVLSTLQLGSTTMQQLVVADDQQTTTILTALSTHPLFAQMRQAKNDVAILRRKLHPLSLGDSDSET